MKINGNKFSQQMFAKSLILVLWTKIAADIFCNEISSYLLKVAICTLTHPLYSRAGCVRQNSTSAGHWHPPATCSF